MNNKIKVAVFDLDNTLVNINTTTEFIKFYLKKHNKLKYFLYLFYFYIFKDFFVIFPKHDIRQTIIQFLKGEKKQTLEEEALLFSLIIKENLNPEVNLILEQFQKKGLKIFILSSSFDLLVQALIKTLRLDKGKGSSLGFKNKICTGYLQQDLTGVKQEALQQDNYFGIIDFQNSYCISDNKEDLELLRLFSHSLAIVYNRVDALYFEKNNIKHKFIAPVLPITEKELVFPLSYFFYTRADPLFLSTFVINSQIIFHLVTLYFFKNNLNWFVLVGYFLALIGFYSIYEIFYLENDCIAFKEKYPTLRINKVFCNNKKIFTGWRLGWYFIICCILVVLKYNIGIYLLATFVLIFIYIIHNFIMESSVLKQYLSGPLLFFSHLYIPLSIFNISFLYVTAVFILYAYTLAKNLNFISKKYRGDNQYWFRFIKIDLFHYIVVFIIFIISLIYPSLNFFHYALMIGMYFILYDSIFSLRHFKEIYQKFRSTVSREYFFK